MTVVGGEVRCPSDSVTWCRGDNEASLAWPRSSANTAGYHQRVCEGVCVCVCVCVCVRV